MPTFLSIRGLAATFAAIMAVGFLGASPASATCLTCGPAPSPSFNGLLTGTSAVAGTGGAVFGGVDGNAFAEKLGAATLELNLGANGGLCTTPDCASATGGLEASFGELIIAGANGVSDYSGTPATAEVQLASSGLITAELPNGFAFGMGSTTQGAGFAGAAFQGDGGNAFASVLGASNNEGSLDVNGVCPSCKAGEWSLNTGVDLVGIAGASAYSHTPSVPVVVDNNVGLAAALRIGVGESLIN